MLISSSGICCEFLRFEARHDEKNWNNKKGESTMNRFKTVIACVTIVLTTAGAYSVSAGNTAQALAPLQSPLPTPKPPNPDPKPKGKLVCTANSNAPIYRAPRRNAKQIGTLPTGGKMYARFKVGGWVAGKSSAGNGWVRSSLLTCTRN
jgi:hypothetical protein